MGSVFGIISEETPKHTVTHTDEKFNVRRYEPILVAEVDQEGKDQGNAFRTLAKYIGVFTTPENSAQGKPQAMAMTAPVFMSADKAPEKIAMTAPVMTSEGEGSKKTMAFVLPSKFTLESVPMPTNPAVKVRQIPGRVCAVHTFTGSFPRIDGAGPKADWFINLLKEKGYTVHPTAKWELAGYNPPWTIPFLRTNEIHVPIVAGPGVSV